jgi:hypothetical protein
MVDERRGLLDLPSLISDELLSRVPGLKEAFRAVDSALQLWFPTTTIATGPMRAVHIASSLAINDFVDLLADLLAGRGRSAVRALRNLFEHLISVLDFGASPLAQQRFIEHRAITEQTAAALTFELDRLLDDERRAEVRRLRKLGKGSARAAAKAIRDYGAGFKRGWAAETLSERAARHGLAGEYEIYRLSSAVLHGSSGGAIGTVFGSAGDRRRSIHRLGPALQLCPISYLKGIAYFKRIVMEIQAIDSSDEVAQRARPLLVALEGMDGLWGDYRRAVLELDVDLLATAIPVPTLLTVLAFERDGTISWWLWNLVGKTVTRVEHPRLSVALNKDIDACRSGMSELLPVYWDRRSRATVVMDHITLTPTVERWQNSEELIFGGKPEATYNTIVGFKFVDRPAFGPPPPPSSLIQSSWEPSRFGV